ncbi:hypothetical protein [Paenibacillus sp. PL91]|uniref:hypothetical protein n=1 Tax=Paenibacillus sp. PL91 TaxID=2729538 RepID=UPI001658F35A|nr:hypothetical protein [Paenibacillus sp. PL91]MBC9202074.1 hypothetical protein [Paenibacillus sp. PL91]
MALFDLLSAKMVRATNTAATQPVSMEALNLSAIAESPPNGCSACLAFCGDMPYITRCAGSGVM